MRLEEFTQYSGEVFPKRRTDNKAYEGLLREYDIATKKLEKIMEKNLELEQENTALKNQLAEIKTLDRKEVEKIFDEELPNPYKYDETKTITMTAEKNIIDQIRSLALPTKEKIIEILDRYSQDIVCRGCINGILRGDFNKIANEILGDKDES